jgi:hypothetical protein
MTEDPMKLEQYKRACLGVLTTGYPSIEDIRDTAEALAANFGITPDQVEAFIAYLETSLGVRMSIGTLLESSDFEPWLANRRMEIDWHYWKRYEHNVLRLDWKLPPEVVVQTDRITDEILDHCGDPTAEGQMDRRGMVVGHVQSGKTANYTGLICKAADAGFKLIIVVAGVHNKLRNQTQRRIDEGFIGIDSAHIFSKDREKKIIGVGMVPNARRPTSFTSSVRDFNKTAATNIGMSILNSPEPVVFVVKKNSSTLRNLLDWLREHNTKGDIDKIDLPMLLIDDEADNASINIAHGRGAISMINKQLRDLLGLFTKSAYVGYTATPFANIFIDPDSDDAMFGEDLFPRDFIFSMDPPSNYCGPNRVFLDEPELFLRSIDDAETTLPLSHKIDHLVMELPESLDVAIRSFVIARAIRIIRGEGEKHMSMLINASRFTGVQDHLRDLVHAEKRDLEDAIRIDGAKPGDNALTNPRIAALKDTWMVMGYSNACLLDRRTRITWNDVQERLLEAVAPIAVVSVNSRSSDPLDYSAHEKTGLSVIAVGGFSLSRGLTLEGLMISYFYRRSLMYDTLMQMGRWFGYREGYADLCRIWMSDDARGWYEHISDSIDLLRAELRKMKVAGLTPKDFGLKVRSHPDSLLITARNKMGSGTRVQVKIGLGNNMIETTTVDPNATSVNTSAVAKLVSTVGIAPAVSTGLKKISEGFLAMDVPCAVVRDFIDSFEGHPSSLLTQKGPVLDYIDARSESTLAAWDVLLVSRQTIAPGTVAFNGFGNLAVNPQTRSAGRPSNATAVRISSKQRVASRGVEKVGVSPDAAAEAERAYENEKITEGDTKFSQNFPDRIYREVRDKPLLLIHVVQLLHPQGDEGPKLTLPETPVIAWGASFPPAPPGEPEERVEFMVNRTWITEHLSTDDTDEEDIDDEDV